MTSRGPRDTRTFYLDEDPDEQVDAALVEFAAVRAGQRVLDLGCGLGGYTKALAGRGFEAVGLDVQPEYIERAREHGVSAETYDGRRIPLEDDSVDTVVALEVIEHVADPQLFRREAGRVARRNVLLSTPNATQGFGSVPVEFSHMLDTDHKRAYTVASLREELLAVFGSCRVQQSAPVDRGLAGLVLPPLLRPVYRGLDRAGLIRPHLFFRLLAEAPVSGGTL